MLARLSATDEGVCCLIRELSAASKGLRPMPASGRWKVRCSRLAFLALAAGGVGFTGEAWLDQCTLWLAGGPTRKELTPGSALALAAARAALRSQSLAAAAGAGCWGEGEAADGLDELSRGLVASSPAGCCCSNLSANTSFEKFVCILLKECQIIKQQTK